MGENKTVISKVGHHTSTGLEPNCFKAKQTDRDNFREATIPRAEVNAGFFPTGRWAEQSLGKSNEEKIKTNSKSNKRGLKKTKGLTKLVMKLVVLP